MKITLIQPYRPYTTGVDAEEHWHLTRPFSLFFLAASLEKYTNCEVEIVDLERKEQKNRKRAPLERIFQKAENSQGRAKPF